MSALRTRLTTTYAAGDTWWRAKPPRVQVLLLFAAVAVVFGLFDTLAWSRLQREGTQLKQRLQAAKTETQSLQVLADQAAAARKVAEERLAVTRAELAKLDAGVRNAMQGAVAPSELPDRLGRAMPRAAGLRAVGLASEAPQALDGSGLWRHPFEVQLEGDWDGLLQHVRVMESELAAVRWRGIDLIAPDWPTLRGKLEVYTLSGQSVWIRL